MRQKKAKRIRKELGYDMKKERIDGRKHFVLTHKIKKNKEGLPLECGIICDEQRRLYQLIKKYS